MSFAMTKEERETFLAGLHVGVLAVTQEGRAPLTVPIWYRYTPGGEVTIITGRTSHKVALIADAGRFSLCAQDEAPPYRYVTVEGAVVAIETADRERDTRPMRQRYLGVPAEPASRDESTTDENNVVIRMRPERWLAVDYGKG
jgi:nitroimidazol reductase NimA-like FMN-containing flavoprotein (pyridoxamine 5'-phosphate oxidase superfamily)